MTRYPRWHTDVYTATVCQVGLSLLFLWLSRFAFAIYNADAVGNPSFAEIFRLALHGLRFDIAATVYFNIFFIAMRIVPFGFVYNRLYIKATNIVYGICNSLLLAINIGDIPYYRFTGARLRWSNLVNIATDSDIAGIICQYAGTYWWAFVGGGLYIALLAGLAMMIYPCRRRWQITAKKLLATRVFMFVIFGSLAFVAMRGRLSSGVPLGIADAASAIKSAPQINVVLNSPYCILRSLNRSKDNIEKIVTVLDADRINAVRNSVHSGAPSGSLKRRNIVTIIIESGGAEWIDTLAVSGRGARRGLMPFLDSLAGKSTVVLHTIATGRMSLGGATAIMAGFPAFDQFYYMLSPYNKNIIDSPARLLCERGWDSAFYYGCRRGSFNIDHTARATGYMRTVDRQTYGNESDFDGAWGIFDYPMAEYVVNDISTMQQPFIAAWFTVSAHGPFNTPQGWNTSSYRHPERSPERGLEYTDEALRHFFAIASQQPWYANTTFIITGDHGNRDFKGTIYDCDYIRNHIPFIIYTPDGSMPAKRIGDRVAAQFDIAATTLGLVGYDAPFVSVGSDVLAETFAGYGISRTDGGRYFVVGPRYSIYTSPDLATIESVYETSADPAMTTHATDVDTVETSRMLTFAQAFMCDYTERLNHDRLSLR